MAPNTRRSAVLKNSAATNGVSDSPSTHASHSAITSQRTPAGSPKRRGRPRKVPQVAGAESVSSAPTPNSTISDSEYSTPATSNAVTPAPSVSAKAATSQAKRTRSRLVVELPELPDDSDESANKPKGFASRARRPRRAVNSFVGDSEEDDDFDPDDDPSAVLARRLQREEDEKAAASLAVELPSSKAPLRRSTRISLPVNSTVDDSDDDPDDELDDELDDEPDVPSPIEPATNGKGKAVAATKPVKRSGSSNESASVKSDGDDDDDLPLAHSAPARKKRKLTQGISFDEDMPLPGAPSGVISLLSSEEEGVFDPETDSDGLDFFSSDSDDGETPSVSRLNRMRRAFVPRRHLNRAKRERESLEKLHPELKTMWSDLEKMPVLKTGEAEQPKSITRQLKGFQLEGLAWMKAMEQIEWKGGLLGDEMGLGKTIQAVSLIMSDYPAKSPSLVLVPPVALMQWTSEIDSYTDGKLKTLVYHGTNSKSKNMTTKDLKKFDVILMSYNSLESLYRKQEKGFKRKEGMYKEKSAIHQTKFHRVILDEAHCIKTKTTMTAKACFALKVDYRWCLTGTPLQNRIGEFFSLIRFLNIAPFASYFCRQCACSSLEWTMTDEGKCVHCKHHSMRHISVFNQELLNPIQKYGNRGEGKAAFRKLRLMTDRIMLRRLKRDHTNSMELPVKEIYVDRQFFGEVENDFANSIMTSGQRKFDTYVAQGVLLNNYANIFGLIMQMRQVADHPDLILKKSSEGGQNVLVCCICDEPAEEAIRSKCRHDFCRSCAKTYINSQDQPDCPHCHIPLSIDLEQPEIEQEESLVKKSSIINRIKMENWTSSSKIELLVHELHKLRSDNATHKSIIFSQFTTMLQLIEWRLRRAGISTVMLDGSMTPAQRQASINHFMKNVEVECFLVSLKAGGVALNLTEASRVFIVDPWWNPAAEWQSADRCHRIGQTRPCTITRLCIEDSVESRMVLLQEKKTNMINSTINSDDSAMESLTPEDLQFLFRGN